MLPGRDSGHCGSGTCLRTILIKPSILLLLLLLAFQSVSAKANVSDTLNAGFNRMYELKFPEARQVFNSYIRKHPSDPMGEVSLAASYLFEEFNKHGVLTSSFFLNNKKLLGGIPDPGKDRYQTEFLRADSQARQMAQRLLAANPSDRTGLFVITLADGMQADYDALVAKRDLDSLMLLHRTKKLARKLLAVDPGADDAYLALGAANYIIGCLPGYKRFFLSLGGIHGSRKLGMHQLRLAAQHGHYLKPFAKVMLALAALREKQPALALQLFKELHDQFPENHVFASELAKLR
jgi:tetratricopeptide (TPR) repeat protein